MYHKKVKFPLKISDRAWWLEVQVLKHQGKSSRRKDNGPKDMEVDHVGVVHTNLSSKACQSKDVVTEVAPVQEQDPTVQTSLPTKDGSCIASVSAEENVGYFKNMRRECQVKSFDGLGPFSYVCRMIRFSEPNTKEVEQRVLVDSAFEEHVEGDQHYVHVVNPERVRGFPVEINLEEGESNPEGLNDDGNENVLDEAEAGSGYVPTTPPKSDQGSDRESPGKRPREVLKRSWHQVHLIRRIRMIRKEKIRMIQVDEIFLSLKGTGFFNMRVGVIGHMIVGVMHVCKHVVGHLLVVLRRRMRVIRDLLFSWQLIIHTLQEDIGDS